MDKTDLEIQIAHLTRLVEDLSDVVARQDKDLTIALRRIEMLMQREATREAESSGTVPLGDERPPHW
ncbi:SlyX family protein [Loktanella sp. TSTF-M6]|uniref:SlyX family protein n=1 Tax=Loktanella gaetbuli TaxID=2881335 RepID=A0ABS8BX27_9RHOB|nr:SlyX family protein [Loktanella gaetbuli]MCB5200071.1 SlyX family protein [Loktanella gaetbuli]